MITDGAKGCLTGAQQVGNAVKVNGDGEMSLLVRYGK